MHNSGDILETYEEIDNIVFGYQVVAYDYNVSLVDSYNWHMIDCPSCGSSETCVVRLPYWAYPLTDIEFEIIAKPSVEFYCTSCCLVWRNIIIGGSNERTLAEDKG